MSAFTAEDKHWLSSLALHLVRSSTPVQKGVNGFYSALTPFTLGAKHKMHENSASLDPPRKLFLM